MYNLSLRASPASEATLIVPDSLLSPNAKVIAKRRIDWRILPLLGTLYAPSPIDRGNMAWRVSRVWVTFPWHIDNHPDANLVNCRVTSAASSFSSIFAYAPSRLEGKRGLAKWSWILIIEGMVTVIFGADSWIYVPNFPDRNDFLTAEQTTLVLQRIGEDHGDSLPDPLKGIVCCTSAIGRFGCTVHRYANGLRSGKSAPPYIFVPIPAFRSGVTLEHSWPAQAQQNVFLGFLHIYASNNSVSYSKRAVTTAIMASFGGIGGVIATTICRQKDSPNYIPGMITTILLQALLLVLLGILTAYFWCQNKKSRGDRSRVHFYTL
ncbi:hypothetical protein DFS33DRAFT_1449336 [Desarmillaria ectypa]|nr:hypothetical protein DFS33DRAFT_1449336 [Desarmillaria ectypa]